MGRQLQTARRGGRTETVTIAAGKFRDFDGTGDRINCLSSTGSLGLTIDSAGDKMLFRTGIKIRMEHGDDFTRFTLWNDTASSIDVQVYYGFINLEDDRTVISGSLSSPNSVRTTVDTVIAVNGNFDFAADTTVRERHVYNNSGTDTLRYGDVANTGDTRGAPIPPNSLAILASGAAIRLHNPSTSGAGVTVSITEFFEA